MAGPELAVLLPPSEGKASGGTGRWRPGAGRFRRLRSARVEVVEALATTAVAPTADLGKLFGVGGDALRRATDAARAVSRSPALPAHARYTGVVHDHLDVAGLPAAARARAADAVVVVSGLLGVVGIDDPTPDYRLKMGARLDGLGLLSTWWRPTLSTVLNDAAAGRFVLDALPNEHAKAWTPEPERFAGWVQVAFERERDGVRKVIGHEAKAAKGLLVRHVLMSRQAPLTALRRATPGGYRFDPDASELGSSAVRGRAVFVRHD